MTCEQAGMTPMAEYRLRLEGYQQGQRLEWERARWQMFLLMQMHPNIKQHNKAKTPQAWIPFAWEKKPAKAPSRCKLTKKEKNRLNDIFSELIRRKNNG